MSEEQTFRSETMHSASEPTAIITAMGNYVKPMNEYAKHEKDFEASRLGVFTSRFAPRSFELRNSG